MKLTTYEETCVGKETFPHKGMHKRNKRQSNIKCKNIVKYSKVKKILTLFLYLN